MEGESETSDRIQFEKDVPQRMKDKRKKNRNPACR